MQPCTSWRSNHRSVIRAVHSFYAERLSANDAIGLVRRLLTAYLAWPSDKNGEQFCCDLSGDSCPSDAVATNLLPVR